MSPFRPSFSPQPRVFPQPFDFVGPLFSYSYELLFSQPLCFDNDLNCPGGDPIVSLCRRLPRPGRGSKSHVLRALQPLCRLFAFFSALVPFVFKSLQPLLPKHPGWGVPATFLATRLPRASFAKGHFRFAFSDYRECASGDACWAEEEGVARRALKASFMRVRMMRRFWAMLLAHAKRPI